MAIGTVNAVILGGNGQIDKDPLESTELTGRTAEAVVAHIADGSEEDGWVITHGNGPQVGVLATLEENLGVELSVLVGQTQQLIGEAMSEKLLESMARRSMEARFNGVLWVASRAEVAKDEALRRFTKPVGVYLGRGEEAAYPEWEFRDLGNGDNPGKPMRRVVPSPNPVEILGVEELRDLILERKLVLACGGGAVPHLRVDGQLVPIDGVIDKDFASAVLLWQLSQYFKIGTATIVTGTPGIVDPKFYARAMDENDSLTEEEVFADLEKYSYRQLTPEEVPAIVDEMGPRGEGSMTPKLLAAVLMAQVAKKVRITDLEGLNNPERGTVVVRG